VINIPERPGQISDTVSWTGPIVEAIKGKPGRRWPITGLERPSRLKFLMAR